MGLTNWQLFFQDLQNSVMDQPIQDNEVLTVIRTVSDTTTLADSSSYVAGAPATTVGTAQVGYSQVG